MEGSFDFKELSDYQKKLVELAKEQFPKETKNFMGRAGNKFRANVRSAYKQKVKKKTGNLLKGIKRGRPYVYGEDGYQVRVKNDAPHAHLYEHGHVMKDKNGEVIKNANGKEIFVAGKNIVGNEVKNFGSQFEQMVGEYIDDMLERGNFFK